MKGETGKYEEQVKGERGGSQVRRDRWERKEMKKEREIRHVREERHVRFRAGVRE